MTNILRAEHLNRHLVLALRWGKRGLPYPHPLPCKKTWKYNSILTYISVSFFSLLFSFKNFVPVTVKNRVRVSSRVRVRVRVRIRVQGSGFVFGIGNLNHIR